MVRLTPNVSLHFHCRLDGYSEQKNKYGIWLELSYNMDLTSVVKSYGDLTQAVISYGSDMNCHIIWIWHKLSYNMDLTWIVIKYGSDMSCHIYKILCNRCKKVLQIFSEPFAGMYRTYHTEAHYADIQAINYSRKLSKCNLHFDPSL